MDEQQRLIIDCIHLWGFSDARLVLGISLFLGLEILV